MLTVCKKHAAFPLKIHTGLTNTSTRCAGNYIARESRMLKKLMTGSSRPRRKWFNVDQSASKSLEEFSFISGRGSVRTDKSVPAKPIRRVEVLNTIFMEYITGMMATGDVASQVLGLGIEITRVKISNDFSCVNVYWGAKGTESDQIIEDILRKAAGHLRHECSKLRVIGVVPPISFIKDKTFSKLMEVETLLAKCDFGEDFVSTSSKHLFSQKPMPSGLQNSCQSEAEENPENPDTFMRQDILGLDRSRIMDTILMGMKRNNDKLKAKQKFEETSISEVHREDAATLDEITVVEGAKQIQDQANTDKFVDYLKQRQISKAKADKRLTTQAKEREFYESEKVSRWLQTQQWEEEDDTEREDTFDFDDKLTQTFDEYERNKH